MSAVFMLWAAGVDPPYSALVGVFASRELAQTADETTLELGEARHYLRPDRLSPINPRTIVEVPVIGAGGDLDAAERMKAWASKHGECDVQGVMDYEWVELARAALGLPPTEGYGE